MEKTNSGVRRESFVDKAVILSNVTKSQDVFFFNAYYGSTMVGKKSLGFKITEVQFTPILELKKETKGQFNVVGGIRWIGNTTTISNDKKVRDAVIADSSGHIVVSVWEGLIALINDGEFYELHDVSLKTYFGLKAPIP